MQDEEKNGEKIALLTCYAVDGQGREVPNACPYVRFHTEGEGSIMGTGLDVSDHVPPSNPDRQMFAGKITLLVKARKEACNIRVCAENLQSGMLELTF